jgi:hypothetical protein
MRDVMTVLIQNLFHSLQRLNFYITLLIQSILPYWFDVSSVLGFHPFNPTIDHNRRNFSVEPHLQYRTSQ